MDIHVTSGTGTGPTALAAFDAAALVAGRINHNMIYLSSFIPPGAVIEQAKYVVPQVEWGQRVYVVMAREDADERGQDAWAGLGWVQDKSGRGMFVEHHGRSKQGVFDAIHTTLESMIKNRNIEFGPVQYEIVGIVCKDQPVCAIAMAVYEIDRWTSFSL